MGRRWGLYSFSFDWSRVTQSWDAPGIPMLALPFLAVLAGPVERTSLCGAG
jgi:hypothetical protein